MTALSRHISGLVTEFGLPSLFTSVTLEALGAPLPGESAIMVSAATAATGALDIRTVALTAFAGRRAPTVSENPPTSCRSSSTISL